MGVAGVGSHRLDRQVSEIESSLELAGEQQVGQFALAVRAPGAVGALPVEGTEIEAAHSVGP